MDEIYREMKTRNEKLIQDPNFEFFYDPLLKNEKDDGPDRKCLAIYGNCASQDRTDSPNKLKVCMDDILSSIENSNALVPFVQKSKSNLNYTKGTLHFTIFQLLGFSTHAIENFDISILSEIIPIISPLFHSGDPLTITYKGILVTPKAIVLKGYPNKDINAIREKIRRVKGIHEPYQNHACHSTLFRFQESLSSDSTKKLIETCKKYENANLGTFLVPELYIGFGTWKLNRNEVSNLFKFSINNLDSTKILIAHRGNVFGPIPHLENTPSYIQLALDQGYHVEIDVWMMDSKLYLGHDGPQGNAVSFEYLQNPKFWCHAKSHETLVSILDWNKTHSPPIHVFSHDVDECILTSRQYIWSYPGKPIRNSICVMPERVSYTRDEYDSCIGICSDLVGYADILF